MSDPHTAIAERLKACLVRASANMTVAAIDKSLLLEAARLLRASADAVEQLRQAHRDADEQWGLASRAHQKAEADRASARKALEELVAAATDVCVRMKAPKGAEETWEAALEFARQALRAGSGKTELTADFVRALPGGKLDDATYEAIESALDKAEAPCQLDGRWLTLPERVSALQWDRDSLAKSFVESNREIRRIQAEADRASTIGEEGEGKNSSSRDHDQSTGSALEGEHAVHVLKTWPEPFAAIRSRVKTWEFRYDDRGYKVGDTLWLSEWSPETSEFTGENEVRLVTYCLRGGQFGIPKGYVVMSVTDCPDELERALSSAKQVVGESSRDEPPSPTPTAEEVARLIEPEFDHFVANRTLAKCRAYVAIALAKAEAVIELFQPEGRER